MLKRKKLGVGKKRRGGMSRLLPETIGEVCRKMRDRASLGKKSGIFSDWAVRAV
jgi:hypothetical protein